MHMVEDECNLANTEISSDSHNH